MHHICECEHICHEEMCLLDGHEYLAMAEDVEQYPTSFGVFHLCKACAEGCLKDDIASAKIDIERRERLKAQINYLEGTIRHHEGQIESCRRQIAHAQEELQLLGK